jgi:hypothetical protein
MTDEEIRRALRLRDLVFAFAAADPAEAAAYFVCDSIARRLNP